ncbi:GIY-YIG nuclease family protein [Flavobacterium urocaniciphilum]|uniref:Putative endonuclease n=1 Tax=Flavobacterium urocaniciphilum TaxID=1299341 RepID=A0A1H9AGL4_9FLAO|nr:GIY-YIG nuclease family protein [Flavobacterium urocaniciphilum]SEP75637.1 putative endonuclease [Flavobacterium urocaniciphilum]
MRHFLYILYSSSTNKFYIGETSDVTFRLNLHNTHEFKGSFTKIASDWEIKLSFENEQKSNILYLEKFIKKMKSKVFIQKIIENPEILNDILSKK